MLCLCVCILEVCGVVGFRFKALFRWSASGAFVVGGGIVVMGSVLDGDCEMGTMFLGGLADRAFCRIVVNCTRDSVNV